MLHAAALFEDRVPHIGGILALLAQKFFEIGVLDDEAARQRLVRVDIGRDRFDTGARAAADDADRRGRCDRHLAAETFHRAHFFRIGAGPAFMREDQRGFFGLAADMFEHLEVPDLRHRPFQRDILRLQEGVETHYPKTDRPFAHGRIFGPGHLRRRAVDIILQDIIEHAHDIFDEALVLVPFVPFFEIERRQAAHRRAVIAQMINPGRQGDFAAQVGGGNLQPQFAVMLGHHPVHRIVEHDIGFTRGEAGFDQLLEQAARINIAAHFAGLGRFEFEAFAIAHRFHELIGHQHAVMQVQRLAVEVSAGFADFEKLLDLRVRDVEIACGRTAPQ